MESRGQTWLAMVLVTVALGELPIPAQGARLGPSPSLSQLLAAVQLTGAGVLTWLNRLTNGRIEPVGDAPERLIAVTAHGDILAEIDGAGSHVVLGATLDARCLQPGAEIVLVHNHPSSTGLSPYDLGQLAKPGVRAIVAIGHDGSLYAAAAGPRYPGDQFVEHIYLPARADAEGELRRVAADTTDLRAFLPHVMSTALAQARVLEYQATFAAERQPHMTEIESRSDP